MILHYNFDNIVYDYDRDVSIGDLQRYICSFNDKVTWEAVRQLIYNDVIDRDYIRESEGFYDFMKEYYHDEAEEEYKDEQNTLWDQKFGHSY